MMLSLIRLLVVIIMLLRFACHCRKNELRRERVSVGEPEKVRRSVDNVYRLGIIS